MEAGSSKIGKGIMRRATEIKNASEFFMKKQSNKLSHKISQLGSISENDDASGDVMKAKQLKGKVYEALWESRYVLWVLVFYLANTFIWMAFHPEWSPMQSIYFITASLTTVGYGDLCAESDLGRLYTIFFLLIGLSAVTSVISGWMNRLLEGMEQYFSSQPTEKLIKEDFKDEEKALEEENNAYRYRKIIFSIIIIMICILTGTIFMCATHEWTVLRALYWSFVTVLTVGYGDVSFWHDDGTLLFVSIFMMLSTMCVAVALGNFVEVTIEIEQENKRKKALDELDLTDLIMGDASEYHEVQTFKQKDEQEAHKEQQERYTEDAKSGEAALFEKLQGRKVSKCDFMLFMLEKLNGLDRKKDIEPLLLKFEEIDVDGSGFLDVVDIQYCSKLLDDEKRVRMEREEARRRAGWFSFLYAGNTNSKVAAAAYPTDVEST